MLLFFMHSKNLTWTRHKKRNTKKKKQQTKPKYSSRLLCKSTKKNRHQKRKKKRQKPDREKPIYSKICNVQCLKRAVMLCLCNKIVSQTFNGFDFHFGNVFAAYIDFISVHFIRFSVLFIHFLLLLIFILFESFSFVYLLFSFCCWLLLNLLFGLDTVIR